MSSATYPITGSWYCHLDKGQRFFVVVVNEDTRTVEIQHFDGNVDELDFVSWCQLDIEPCEAPENWSGPFDIDHSDDLGTEITDTRLSDWEAPLNEFESKTQYSSKE